MQSFTQMKYTYFPFFEFFQQGKSYSAQKKTLKNKFRFMKSGSTIWWNSS